MNQHDPLVPDADLVQKLVSRPTKLGRNAPCWCQSGKKYKRCHLLADQQARTLGAAFGPLSELIDAVIEPYVDEDSTLAEVQGLAHAAAAMFNLRHVPPHEAVDVMWETACDIADDEADNETVFAVAAQLARLFASCRATAGDDPRMVVSVDVGRPRSDHQGFHIRVVSGMRPRGGRQGR